MPENTIWDKKIQGVTGTKESLDNLIREREEMELNELLKDHDSPWDLIKEEDNKNGIPISYYKVGARLRQCVSCLRTTNIYIETRDGAVCRKCAENHVIKCQKCLRYIVQKHKNHRYCKECADNIKKDRAKNFYNLTERVDMIESEIKGIKIEVYEINNSIITIKEKFLNIK